MRRRQIGYRVLVFWIWVWANAAFSQSTYQTGAYQFLSYGSIPTWTAVATDWDRERPQLHLYDSERYKGHAQYVSVALKTGITFPQFKELVRNPDTRRYLPFFFYDLRQHPPTVDGNARTWAIRIEDYVYRDTPAQMTATTLRLLRTVSAYVQAATGRPSHGLIILTTNPASQPNTSIAEALKGAGFPYRTEAQLVTLMGGKRAEVLNPGIAYGYLQFIKAGDEAQFRAAPHVIPVFERTPERLPPVAAIITLQPQTPLSHVNLLAMNRGTPNLYAMDTMAIPGLHTLFGNLVRLEASARKIAIGLADHKEAQRHWYNLKRPIHLPPADTAAKGILVFSEMPAARLTPQVVGAKAANYARLQSEIAQYVKPGAAIPFRYYDQVMRSSGAAARLHALLNGETILQTDSLVAAMALLRQDILAAHVDSGLLDSLQSLQATAYGGRRIRLRSSTNCEDLPGFNGAGLYLSKGHNAADGRAALERAILEVYASLWTPLAWEERDYYGIDHRHAAMAILINEAYAGEYANGVVLTVPDRGGYAVVVNTQWGSAAVANPEAGVVPEGIRFGTWDSDKYVVETKSSIHDIFVQPGMEAALLELKAVTVRLHRLLAAQYSSRPDAAYGVDIEFKLVEEGENIRLYIKQARPLSQVLPK